MDMLALYRSKIASRHLQADAAQEQVAIALAACAAAMNAHPPLPPGRLARLFTKSANPPRGLYIHGDVGRGKTMLMDLFYGCVQGWPKRRVHFHAFMQEVHKHRALGEDMARIAETLAGEARLLCLDEMQIVDIADAMIIGRLFEALIAHGVVFVTTSNLPPDGLYRDGLNRDLFLPFIARLEQHLDVVSLSSNRDYRLGRVKAGRTYLSPPTAENRVAFNQLWHDLTDGDPGKAEVLEVLGRKRHVPKASHGCAAFTFYELCGEALGPPDYLAIAKAYRTIFMSGVVRLKAHQRNETKRLILMVDTFYDAGTRLVILAEVPPAQLFAKNQHSFESARTLSRLQEMQSATWWGRTIVET
jgi:cell division protein ZapE